MKHVIIFIASLSPCFSLVAQEYEMNISPESTEATIYLNGAEFRHKVRADLNRGNTKLVLRGLSSSLLGNSIQVTAGNDISLVAVTSHDYSVLPEDIDSRIRQLKDTLHTLEVRLALVNNQMDAYQAEKATLQANQFISGKQVPLTTAELTRFADFFRDRTLRINNALTTLQFQSTRLRHRMDSVQADIDRISGSVKGSRKEISIEVNVNSDQRSEFVIRYLSHDAGWFPSYDLVAEDISKPVQLKYKADIYNNTGIDWKELTINLSTADPTASASRPQLTTWVLNYNSQVNEGRVEDMPHGEFIADDEADDGIVYEDIAMEELSISFPVDKKQNIPGNGRRHTIELSTASLPATFEYLTIPKVELSAFLLAKVTGWQKLNLIDGPANVYFGNTYIGQSKIDTRAMGDTLELSLGRDNQILVTRAKLEDKGSTKLIGTKRSESFTYELQVKNNRKAPLTIRILDQVPVAQESEIDVDVENISSAALESLSGKLQWTERLEPAESVKYTVAFTVRYPKNKNVVIRKQRVVRTARYRH